MAGKYIEEERILQLKGKKHRNLKVNSGDKDSSPVVGKVRERVEKAAQWIVSRVVTVRTLHALLLNHISLHCPAKTRLLLPPC